MVRERWAWLWAKQNALMWTQRMENNCRASLAHYETHPHLLIYKPSLFQRQDETCDAYMVRVKETKAKERKAIKKAKKKYLDSLTAGPGVRLAKPKAKRKSALGA
jgi:hypothetical protein